jgi:hypothetical protein
MPTSSVDRSKLRERRPSILPDQNAPVLRRGIEDEVNHSLAAGTGRKGKVTEPGRRQTMTTGSIHRPQNMLVAMGPSTSLFASQGYEPSTRRRFFKTSLFNGTDFPKSSKEIFHDIP